MQDNLKCEEFLSDDYEDGITKQAYKDECDVNKLIARAQRGDTLGHLARHGAMYGDFSDIDDLLTAHARLQKGMEIFNDLPSEIRNEFYNDAGRFFNYVNDPKNVDRLGELLPGLAAPGRDLPPVGRPKEVIDKVEAAKVPDQVPAQQGTTEGGATPPTV